jgi:UDP-glucose 4-epimerase
MRVLVTGATGAIGSFVVDHLRRRGDVPIAFSRSRPGTDVPWAAGDVGERKSLIEACRTYEVERIIHLAAVLVHADRERERAVDTNITGTLNVVEAAARCGVERVVNMSSKAVFGEFSGAYGPPGYRPVPEDYPTGPRSLYGATKLAAERIGQDYHDRGLVEFVSVRAGTTVGPNKGERHGATRLVSDLIEAIFRGDPYVVERGGDEPDDLIYNEDLARGLVALCTAERLNHPIYHLSTGRLTTIRDIAEALVQRVPGARVEVGGGGDPFGLGYAGYGLMSSALAAADVGFAPAIAFPGWVDAYLAHLAETAASSAGRG